MIRTTIMLPKETKQRAMAEARKRNISFADFVRHALNEKVAPAGKGGDHLRRRRLDPLFKLLKHLPLVDNAGPDDVAARHDDYLYGEMPTPNRS